MSTTNENRPSNVWDEKLWAFANIKAARDFGINTANELNNKAAEIIGLNAEQKTERAKNDKLRHVVTSEWSRTDLKNKGLIINESRGTGVWRLTQTGLQINCTNYETFLTDYKQIPKQNPVNYISQEIITHALKNTVFRELIKGGSATTQTSLIFQTLAFHAAITRNGASNLEIKARTEGRKLMASEYTNLVGCSVISYGEDSDDGYLSCLGIKNRESFEIKTNKDAASVLSSNFFTNIAGRNNEYADFIYNETEDKLTSKLQLTEFKSAIAELDSSSVKNLIILALRSVEFQSAALPAQIVSETLIKKFGAAGEALWSILPTGESINIDSTDSKIASLAPVLDTKIESNSNLNHRNRLICALASKPFVIIAGGTGTGKTNAARQVAIQIAGRENVHTLAVGADWTDNRPLLGFRNLLSTDANSYVAPAALQLILKAIRNQKNSEKITQRGSIENTRNEESIKPFFLILDEMNLSHVERYFADFLSSMESGEVLKLHDYKDGLKADGVKNNDGTDLIVPHEVEWPQNLFVIGTVNIDETTYMFSPKVLDRAHVLEFKVEWNEIKIGLSIPPVKELTRWSAQQTQNFTLIAMDDQKVLEKSDQVILENTLAGLHTCMKDSRYNFAHRTARECLKFVASAKKLSGAKLTNEAGVIELIDLAILQKALPKLNGSASSLTEILTKLSDFTSRNGLNACSAKINSMIKQLKNDQFVSFIQ